jgi:hypothetical protein
MGALGEMRHNSYSFTTSALDGGELSASRHGRTLPRRKDLDTYILISAGKKFRNKKKFRYVIPAYTGPFRALPTDLYYIP